MLAFIPAPVVYAQETKPKSPGGVDWCANSWDRNEDAALLTNLTESPLTLSITENKRHLLLSNVTSKQITGYKLGVVTTNKGALKLIRTSVSIATNLGINEMAINPKAVDDELAFCRKKKAKLVVVEVAFADGSFWYGNI